MSLGQRLLQVINDADIGGSGYTEGWSGRRDERFGIVD